MAVKLFTLTHPGMDQLPLERRKFILKSFFAAPEAVLQRERFAKLPFQLAAWLVIVVMIVMVGIYDMEQWRCMVAGFLCFVIGVPIGILVQVVNMKRAFKRYFEQHSKDAG
jgi:ABC-type proline/glycine betaine transport system permease subunit